MEIYWVFILALIVGIYNGLQVPADIFVAVVILMLIRAIIQVFGDR